MGKLDHKVPFPLAGKGFYLFFSMQGLAEIEEFYDATYFEDVERLLGLASAKAVIRCLNAGLMKPDGEPAMLDFKTKQPFTIAEARPLIMEAISLSLTGKSYQTLIAEAEAERARLAAENRKAMEAAEKSDDPFMDSGVSSDTKPTASTRASARKRSG